MRSWGLLSLVAALALGGSAGCASRGAVASDRTATPPAPSYEEAARQLMATIDTVHVEGAVSTEDRSPLPPGTIVRVKFSAGLERRRVGGPWTPDSTNLVSGVDSVSLSPDGKYSMRVPALITSGDVAEPLYHDAGGAGFVRFAENPGLKISADGGGASASEYALTSPQTENHADLVLRYPSVRLDVIVETAAVRSDARAAADSVYALPFGTPVRELRAEGDWLRIRYAAGLYGWLPANQVGDADALAKAKTVRDAAWAKSVDRMHLRPDIADAMKARKVVKGMTTKQVEAIWGKPERTESLKDTGISRERWLYVPGPLLGSRRVIFESNKVTEVQQD